MELLQPDDVLLCVQQCNSAPDPTHSAIAFLKNLSGLLVYWLSTRKDTDFSLCPQYRTLIFISIGYFSHITIFISLEVEENAMWMDFFLEDYSVHLKSIKPDYYRFAIKCFKTNLFDLFSSSEETLSH